MTGLLILIVNVIRDSLTGCQHPDWYPWRRSGRDNPETTAKAQERARRTDARTPPRR